MFRPFDTRVSIILTVLNEESGLSNLFRALLAQSRQADEIVVVDGGSRDRTVEILREFAATDRRIRVVVEPGVNIARGRNIAIERAVGPVIAVIDGGCHPDPNWLRELVRPMEEEGYGAVGGGFAVKWHGRFEYFAGLLSTPKDSGDERTRYFYGRSSAFLKEAWRAAGGYPEWLYTGEDTLFAVRVRELGWRIGFAPLSVVAWRSRPTLRKFSKMFFLYGRGNGRAGLADMGGARYHLRNYGLLIVTLLSGFIHPAFLLSSVLMITLIWRIVVAPVMKEIRQRCREKGQMLYVPTIVVTRNLACNLGYWVGYLERRYKQYYRKNLEQYRQRSGSLTAREQNV